MRPPRFQPTPRPKPAPRASANARGYGRRWNKLAKQFLALHPLCADPFKAHGERVVPAEHVDHVIPRSRGGTDDPSNLSPLCRRCHSRKTATFDGGFGHAKRTGGG